MILKVLAEHDEVEQIMEERIVVRRPLLPSCPPSLAGSSVLLAMPVRPVVDSVKLNRVESRRGEDSLLPLAACPDASDLSVLTTGGAGAGRWQEGVPRALGGLRPVRRHMGARRQPRGLGGTARRIPRRDRQVRNACMCNKCFM